MIPPKLESEQEIVAACEEAIRLALSRNSADSSAIE